MKQPLCPLCKSPTHVLFRPFCSQRCQAVDLAHWFKEAYRVPAEEHAEHEGDENQG